MRVKTMPQIKLWILGVILGLSFAGPHLYGLLKPAEFGALLKKFPRHVPSGVVLMILATLWFLANLRQESASDFLSFKPALFALFAAVGIGTCVYVQDFLPVRGLAVLMLLAAKSMVDSARWVETEWRLVITTWAYVWVMAGMWFTISPWRLRDLINWSTATEERLRLVSGVRFAFGLFVLLLAVTVYRTAPG